MIDPLVMSEDEFRQLVSDDMGICLNCGDITTGCVEPDAEGYKCEHCEQMTVIGAENALVAGHVEFSE